MMGEANTDAPAPRKRGRPRTVTDDQQVPEVGRVIRNSIARTKLTI